MTVLSPRAHRVLTGLQTKSDSESLAKTLSIEPTDLRQTLTHLVDAGLVIAVDDDTFDLTPSGRRILARTSSGSSDNSYDLDPPVRRAIDAFGLRPDRAAAVRAAYLFLKYWGDATRSEIEDAIYREHPAGYESSREWWDDCVHERLRAIPDITSSPDTAVWRYTDSAIHEHTTDGRHVSKTYGSVRHAIEHLTEDGPERTAVRTAFDLLYNQGCCTKQDLVESVFPEYPAGYDSAQAWFDNCIRRVLEQLPRVERSSEAHDTWRYSQDYLLADSPD